MARVCDIDGLPVEDSFFMGRETEDRGHYAPDNHPQHEIELCKLCLDEFEKEGIRGLLDRHEQYLYRLSLKADRG